MEKQVVDWIYKWTQCDLVHDYDWDKPPDTTWRWELLSLAIAKYPMAILLWRRERL